MTASPSGFHPDSLGMLDSVDWSRFRPRNRADAEHDACEIPDLIRGLAAAEGEAAHKWAVWLHAALVHGSGFYFRTVEPTAPFLIELCRHERPEVAAEALGLLLSCVGADGPFHPEPLRPRDRRELSELISRTRAIVQAGRQAYYPWLRSAHLAARIGALELLGVLEPEAPEFQQELARLEASDGSFRIQQAIREIRHGL